MKLAEILPEHTEHKVIIAFDHLRLSLSQLEWAYQYLDIFQALFAEPELENSDEN
jgi:hypothetical protein